MNKEIEKKTYDTLIFSAGGCKGYAFSGAILKLHNLGYINEIHTYIGISIGSLYACMLAVGFSIYEVYLLSFLIDLKNLVHFNFNSVMHKYGVSSTEYLVQLLCVLIQMKLCKNDITFKQLYDKTKNNLIIYTTNISKNKIRIFSTETTPDSKIIDAVTISMSLPPLFEPTTYEGDLYVDGALLCGFPFDQLIRRPNSLGLRVVGDDNNIKKISSLQEYASRILYCTLNNLTNYRYENLNKDCRCRIITIKTKDVNTIEFNLSQDCKKKIMDRGEKAVFEWHNR